MFGLSYDDELLLHERIALGMILISVPTFLALYFVVPAPWGKTLSASSLWFGPLLPARLSWFLFESPNLVWSYQCWKERREDMSGAAQFLLLLFVGHYVQRAILYPILLSDNTKRMPALVVVSAWVYCNFNGYLQAQSLCQFQSYPTDWQYHPQFLLGLVLFLTGVAINIQSDAILRRLRKSSASYQIPVGGLFDYVSAPHYFGEILEWTGYALACNCTAAFSFVLFTAANLIPRGVAHHAWYQAAFENYPADRKAVIPFLW